MTELKPCPFCGNKAMIFNSSFGYFVSCNVCEVETPAFEYRETAIEAWNRRVNNETD